VFACGAKGEKERVKKKEEMKSTGRRWDEKGWGL